MKNFWNKKKVLITGHTGFKGSWLSLMLLNFNAKVYGISLKPNKKDLNYVKSKLDKKCKNYFFDICNFKRLNKTIEKIQPDIIFHLAAQPLVIEGYINPKKTYNTNTMGTLNILESIKKNKIKTSIIITTDKVYKNDDTKKKFNENHDLGGSDPYSSSKHLAELIVENYNTNYFKGMRLNVVTARAGNVIGGGDRGENRLIPDFFKASNEVILRSPSSTRPWQFIIDPLDGYLKLAKFIHNKKLKNNHYSWNFAPNNQKPKNVKYIIDTLNKKFNKKIIYKNNKNILEKKYLNLNSQKATKYLRWNCKYTVLESIKKIIDWEYNFKMNKVSLTIKQIKEHYKKFK
jgi:CDP-glucose 4,6-dehydratase